MQVIGVGNTGAKLALMFDKNATVFSTATQDTNNYLQRGVKVLRVSEQGASKRFSVGSKIWSDNIDKVKDALQSFWDEEVIIFSSLGGGSGSSSLAPITNILIEQDCKVLIVGVLPFKKEVNPPLANSVQAINGLLPIINEASVILFDNEKLVKLFKNNWTLINKHIVRVIDYIVNLLEKYNTDNYSPVTMDQSELNSIIFGGGFLDFSDTFLEEKMPKFEYGSLDRDTKNCMICMFVDDKIENNEEVDKYQNTLAEITTKFGRRLPNARLIPGILRGIVRETNSAEGIKDRCYFTIASGLSIEKYLKKIEKIRDAAIQKAEAYSQKTKAGKIIGSRDSRTLDI